MQTKLLFAFRRWVFPFYLFVIISTVAGCSRVFYSEQSATKIQEQDIGSFPYHPVVFHLDLSILAYQLYAQTLAWPFDPYYEDASSKDGGRTQLMNKVREWAKTKGHEQVNQKKGLNAYRGPGILSGFDNNSLHDPIIYQYAHLHPWSNTITNAVGTWIEYLAPKKITKKIHNVYMCYRKTGEPENQVVIDRIISQPPNNNDNDRDILLAFEGGTGDKDEVGQPSSQSLMGFVLVRFVPGKDNYDVHIAFRGSRSGSSLRAVKQAFSDTKASGNPDWITNLGYKKIGPENGAGHITNTGNVNRGVAKSMESIFPQLFRCLSEVVVLSKNILPDHIYVTGHSLGGALAQHFVSAILLGNRYGPDATGPSMPDEIRNWPWKQIKLITFSAPRVGDTQWAEKLTIDGLESDFFSTAKKTFDKKALKITDSSIIPRLFDKNRAVGYRILVTTDPISTRKFIGGNHVGRAIYLNKRLLFDAIKPSGTNAHEPAKVREYMLASLADNKIPLSAWNYRKMKELNPERNKSKRGTAEEYLKLGEAIHQYYRNNDNWFEHEWFETNLNLFLNIFQSKYLDQVH
jgi:hypothetical protein